MEWITEPEAWIALLTLTALEIVLGIDNIVFISILCGRLPEHQQSKARKSGLAVALVSRLLLLLCLSWVMGLTRPLFAVAGYGVSGRDLILILGGLFLIYKSTRELHHLMEESGEPDPALTRAASFGGVLLQVFLIDVVFSLDSVITAVGMVDHIGVMVTAIVIGMVVMIVFVDRVSAFIERRPTFKVLALSFLILIGLALLGEGLGEKFGLHIPKGSIYFAMGFSILVELINSRVRRKRALVPGRSA